MENRYRIKEEYKKFVLSDIRDELFYVSEHAGWRIVGRDEDTILCYNEMFEKVEERIEVKKLQIESGGSSETQWKDCRICFESKIMPEYDDIKDTLEAYLNGELVEKGKLLSLGDIDNIYNEWWDLPNRYDGGLPIESSSGCKVEYGMKVEFHTYLKSKLTPKEQTTEVPISDCGSEAITITYP